MDAKEGMYDPLGLDGPAMGWVASFLPFLLRKQRSTSALPLQRYSATSPFQGGLVLNRQLRAISLAKDLLPVKILTPPMV